MNDVSDAWFIHFNNKKPAFEKKRASAGPTRLELATSALTGQRSNQLSYDPKTMFVCGLEGNRTPDLVNAIQALSQLSYEPVANGSDKIMVICRKNQAVFFIKSKLNQKVIVVHDEKPSTLLFF